MSFQVLSRKYRPKLLADLIGQDHVVRALEGAIRSHSIGHAYLFTGTRGIGKTSAARIFAKALTCEKPQKTGDPCLQCTSCMAVDRGTSIDVQEIDGASHNGVEHARNLIDNMQYLPSAGSYRVYIIDEVHMLSVQAFNAFLKTLEEPPEHVVFILATTEPGKLLDTVLSRCQRFDFRSASLETLVTHLVSIVEREKVSIDRHVLRQIAREGKGSFRDALSILDQLLTYVIDGEVTEEMMTHALGLVGGQSLKLIINAILKGDLAILESTYRQCLQENVDLNNLIQGLLDSFYFIIQHTDDAEKLCNLGAIEEGLLEKISRSELFWLFETLAKDFEWAIKSIDPEKVIEVILKKVALRREFFESIGPSLMERVGEKDVTNKEDVVEDLEEQHNKNEVLNQQEGESSRLSWDGFMEGILKKYPALGANLDQGNILEGPVVRDGQLYVDIGFDHYSGVFLSYLKDTVIFNKLKEEIKGHFSVLDVSLQLTMVPSDHDGGNSPFKSRQEESENKIKDKLISNEYIQKAKSLFNSNIDRVTLRDGRKS